MKNRKDAIRQAGPDSGWAHPCELRKDSSQATISTPLMQMRNIKLRETACQGTQLKKGWGDGQDPLPRPACSQSISLQRSRALHVTSAHLTLRQGRSVLTVPASLQLWGELHSREWPDFWKFQLPHCEAHWEIKIQSSSFVY